MTYWTREVDTQIEKLLKNGGIGFMPSDTIYGLSCRALDQAAVERLRQVKGRSGSKRMIVLIADIGQLQELDIAETEIEPAIPYWPGPLTLIASTPRAPLWLHRGGRTFGIRMPDDDRLRRLISDVGPIISTSANPEGQTEARTARQAKAYFGDKLDFYVDAGPIEDQSSTIVRPVFGKLEVIRQGAVKVKSKDIYDAG